MRACVFFGHRDSFNLDVDRIKSTVENLIFKGVDTFYVAHQGSFDGTVYKCLKELRELYPHIELCVVLAYIPTKDSLFGASDTMYPPIEGHPKFAVDRRNRWMVNHADYCVCYINRTWGGAYKFAQMAKRRGLEVINLGELGEI